MGGKAAVGKQAATAVWQQHVAKKRKSARAKGQGAASGYQLLQATKNVVSICKERRGGIAAMVAGKIMAVRHSTARRSGTRAGCRKTHKRGGGPESGPREQLATCGQR